jgi:hypothetical protein
MDVVEAARTQVETVVSLADDHAAAFIDCMSQARTKAELQAALAGSFLAFLAEAAGLNADGD